jgi:hypothetical protein
MKKWISMGDDGESDDERDDGEERASERKRRGGKDLCFNSFKGQKWRGDKKSLA